MHKIFFLIPFFIVGCSTPEIHIPSYNFSSDANSTEDANTTDKATSPVDSIEDTNSSDTPTIETIQADIENNETSNTALLVPTLPPEKEIVAPTPSTDILVEEEESEDLPITKPIPKTKKTKNINKSGGFFSSMFKPKQKVKNEYFTGGKIRSKLVMSDTTGESGLLYKYGYEGQVTSTVHVKHGIKNGLETLFDAKGRVMKRTPFVSGKKDGIVEVYYADGKVLAQIAYVNNKRHGRASKYNHDGTTNEEVQYNHGKVQTQESDIEIPIID